jgi:hypothetical protein
MIKYLIAIVFTLSAAYSQTVKTLSYDAANGRVIYGSTNQLNFTNNTRFSKGITLGTNEAEIRINNDLIIHEDFNGAVGFVIYTNEFNLYKPITFFNSDVSGATRTNLGLGWSALTNTNGTNFAQAVGFSPLVFLSTVPVTNGGTGATNASQARTNLELGTTNNVVFASVNAGSAGTGIRQSGLDGVLRFDAGTLERARLTPTYQFVLLGNNGNLAFGPDNTIGAAITRSNLGIYPDILTYWAARDSSDTYIASSVTGGASVTASYGDSVAVLTNPSGRGLPFYRFNVPAVNPRTNSDMAAIRSAWGSQAYFAGPVRTKIDWSENKYIYMRLASPAVGGGTFQFAFGETTTPTFSTNVNGQLPVPSEAFIGFRLTRSGTPAFWIPTIITRTSSGGSIITNTGENMSTNLIGPVSRLFLSYEAGENPVVSLYSLSLSGSKSLVASYTNATAFTNSTNANQVNWLMGITPTPPIGTNTVGVMTYDVEPPIIVQ